MEQSLENIGQQDGDPSFKHSVRELKREVDRYLRERDLGALCNVTVKKNGRWFELKGTINSLCTKWAIFSLVPRIEGRQYIIDKLQTAAAPVPERTAWA
jgi:hypothetical protein